MAQKDGDTLRGQPRRRNCGLRAVVATDNVNDLALLETRASVQSVSSFMMRPLAGANVSVSGFPLGGPAKLDVARAMIGRAGVRRD